jgi:hypothetical protein
MNNPFISKLGDTGYEYPTNCSLNRIKLAKLPIKGIEDDIEGKIVLDIFGAGALINEIKKYANELKIDLNLIEEKELPKYLSASFESDDFVVVQTANDIVRKFGNRLGLILLTLKMGEQENQLAREDWNKEMWDYWANIKTIILVGGLASGVLGVKFKEYTINLFHMAKVDPYEIILFNNSAHIGVMGCATQIKEQNSMNIIFDFGQTNIKRSIVKICNGEISNITSLESRISKYARFDITDNNENYEEAKKLHEYLMQAIIDTYNVAKECGEVGSEIIISIASYTIRGKLDDNRGGYAKLSNLAFNYADYLSEELSKLLSKEVKVTLIHDGTAAALNFRNYKDSVCITMGTAFGIGFPEIKI